MLASNTERLASTSGYISVNNALKPPHPVNTQCDITGDNKALLSSFDQFCFNNNLYMLSFRPSVNMAEVPLTVVSCYDNILN